ncbi:hypothetical protein BDP67DRAFT_514451 [Colletotrichum lupini]|nr:hypothetical protein BDP67DRAFT_514451 [Colletotrichum lupini]
MTAISAPPPVHSALDAIGNTPCVRLRSVVPEGSADVYLKLESLNPQRTYPFKSIKQISQTNSQI